MRAGYSYAVFETAYAVNGLPIEEFSRASRCNVWYELNGYARGATPLLQTLDDELVHFVNSEAGFHVRPLGYGELW
ncbi:hypothetical protein BPTFM16_02143 [Altererythrobacter insulae]|nr:hypothetical protein BPTFM16_02143 [Altererythrobacter insulae]